MRKVAVLSATDAAALIPDGAVVTVSSSSALGCPDAVLRGIGERFASDGSPSGLTTIHPIGAGDAYGVKGIDHLVRPGLLRRVVAGSFPSGPSSMEPPLIWQAIERDEVEAYNLPSVSCSRCTAPAPPCSQACSRRSASTRSSILAAAVAV